MLFAPSFLKFIMKVDHCFILAAGFGTRMGAIGKELPKVLWPVFEKTLLELQVEFAKRLGIDSIYFNVHHQATQILNYRKESLILSQATPLVEEAVLDIGGGIHNFAKEKNYQGKVLILNADQFLMFNTQFIESLVDEDQVATLFTKTVKRRDGYNKLLLENSKLVDIIPNKDVEEDLIQTYSGCGIINLEKLGPTVGASAFFKSVANFQERKVLCLNTDHLEYNDFGTRDRYFESIQEVLRDRRPELKDFLNEVGAYLNHSLASGQYLGRIQVNAESISLDGMEMKSSARFQYKGIQDN